MSTTANHQGSGTTRMDTSEKGSSQERQDSQPPARDVPHNPPRNPEEGALVERQKTRRGNRAGFYKRRYQKEGRVARLLEHMMTIGDRGRKRGGRGGQRRHEGDHGQYRRESVEQEETADQQEGYSGESGRERDRRREGSAGERGECRGTSAREHVKTPEGPPAANFSK